MNHFEENTAGITSITSSLSLEEEATPGGKLTPLQLASTSLMVHTVVHAGLGPASYSQVKKKEACTAWESNPQEWKAYMISLYQWCNFIVVANRSAPTTKVHMFMWDFGH